MEVNEVYEKAVAVTPSNTTRIADTKALYVGGAGNLAVEFPNGNSVTINGVTAGTLLPLRVRRVLSTGTTASDITAFL
jgi:hypothetical protein